MPLNKEQMFFLQGVPIESKSQWKLEDNENKLCDSRYKRNNCELNDDNSKMESLSLENSNQPLIIKMYVHMKNRESMSRRQVCVNKAQSRQTEDIGNDNNNKHNLKSNVRSSVYSISDTQRSKSQQTAKECLQNNILKYNTHDAMQKLDVYNTDDFDRNDHGNGISKETSNARSSRLSDDNLHANTNGCYQSYGCTNQLFPYSGNERVKRCENKTNNKLRLSTSNDLFVPRVSKKFFVWDKMKSA